MAEEVQHNDALHRYELVLPGGTAVADYIQQGDTLLVTHTGTPPALRGQGVANRLVKGMLADVRARGLKVNPLCSFVEAYFRRHPEERDLLAEGA